MEAKRTRTKEELMEAIQKLDNGTPFLEQLVEAVLEKYKSVAMFANPDTNSIAQNYKVHLQAIFDYLESNSTSEKQQSDSIQRLIHEIDTRISKIDEALAELKIRMDEQTKDQSKILLESFGIADDPTIRSLLENIQPQVQKTNHKEDHMGIEAIGRLTKLKSSFETRFEKMKEDPPLSQEYKSLIRSLSSETKKMLWEGPKSEEITKLREFLLNECDKLEKIEAEGYKDFVYELFDGLKKLAPFTITTKSKSSSNNYGITSSQLSKLVRPSEEYRSESSLKRQKPAVEIVESDDESEERIPVRKDLTDEQRSKSTSSTKKLKDLNAHSASKTEEEIPEQILLQFRVEVRKYKPIEEKNAIHFVVPKDAGSKDLINHFKEILDIRSCELDNTKAKSRKFWTRFNSKDVQGIDVWISNVFIDQSDRSRFRCAFCTDGISKNAQFTLLSTLKDKTMEPHDCEAHRYHIYCAAFLIECQRSSIPQNEPPWCLGMSRTTTKDNKKGKISFCRAIPGENHSKPYFQRFDTPKQESIATSDTHFTTDIISERVNKLFDQSERDFAGDF